MSYYKEKLEQYRNSNNGVSLEERMQIAKERKEEQLANEFAILKKQYGHSLAIQASHHSLQAFSTIYNLYGVPQEQLKEEIQEIKELSPQEYFSKVAMKEILGIITYNQDKMDSYQQVTAQLSPSNSVISSIREAFGFKKDVPTLMAKQEELEVQYNVGSEALQEWQSLSQDDKISYVVDRAFLEDTYEFSEEKLDEYSIQQETQTEQVENDESQDTVLTGTIKPEFPNMQPKIEVEDTPVQ